MTTWRVVFDSTVLVSAFLNKTGVSAALLRQFFEGAFSLFMAREILEETATVLARLPKRHPRRYVYSAQSVATFLDRLWTSAEPVGLLHIRPVITRDPNDDMVIASAVKAKAHYLVTRDKDLLVLKQYKKTTIATPEEFAGLLRDRIGNVFH